MKKLLFRFVFISFFVIVSIFLLFYLLSDVFTSSTIPIKYSLRPLDLAKEYPRAWQSIKFFYLVFYLLSSIIISNSLFSLLFSPRLQNKKKVVLPKETSSCLELLIGVSDNNEIYSIPEEGLYQNILITGSIGSGKTSSAMYPFLKQLLTYKASSSYRLAMLILDVKGSFYSKVKDYCSLSHRLEDLITIALGKIKYNPLDKPNLKPSILANRLKTILTLFSTNNSDSYWLDKAETAITEAIKLCRIYNNGYVTFLELHKLILVPEYYQEKVKEIKELFRKNSLTEEQKYDLLSAMDFFEKEFTLLDSRVLSIIKSEITRITSPFINDLEVLSTFCATKREDNNFSFREVLEKGKIVVLNMNIAEYQNLSRILAAYLKLDFQTEIIKSLSCPNSSRKTVFFCDEYSQYCTASDSDFFSLSREAKCINIICTQSYSSLIHTLKDSSCAFVILQNLVNKLWFRTDDSITIEDAQKQIGREEKGKTSQNITENAKETVYDYFSNHFKSSHSSLSESISHYTQKDFVYDTNFFTQELQTFSCLAFLSDGQKIQKPVKLNMTPYFLSDFPKNYKNEKELNSIEN